MLDKDIYYVDDQILSLIQDKLRLIETDIWHELYIESATGKYWKLDKADRLQVRFLIRIQDIRSWKEFDDPELKVELLKIHRGMSNETCAWDSCGNPALNRLAFCAQHAFHEMGIRK
jgi:hypothetical protein